MPTITANQGWRTETISFTVGSVDVSGGITLQFNIICGADAGCEADANIDNVSVAVIGGSSSSSSGGSSGGGGTTPTVAAPTPSISAGDVISIFSGGAYTDVVGTDFNPNWGQATVSTIESVAGNDTLKYAGLNYQGTTFSAQDLTTAGMTHLHVDFWTADSTALNVYAIKAGGPEVAYALTVTPSTWVSVDIPLTAFAGVDLTGVDQFKFDGDGTVFLDNLYFYIAPPATEPTVAASAPTRAGGSVIAIFSDPYNAVVGTDFNPNWGQATVSTTESVAGNDTLKYAGLNYQGTTFTAQDLTAAGMTHLHVDFWTADSTALNVYTIKAGGAEVAYALTITPSTWVSVDIPLTAFAGVDLTGVDQFKFDGDGTVFLDNLYFYDETPATTPVVAAPTPTEPVVGVISIFSGGAYTDVVGTDFNPNWGQATVSTTESIAGNDTLKYAGLNYQGTVFTAQDLTAAGVTHLYVDYWTADSTALNVYAIKSGGVETPYALAVAPATLGVWLSADIPLSAFTGVDLTGVDQFKFDGNGTIFLDNLYFY
jgi:hypothetical protein